uniref:Uncharacterized protein n=1 Tax=Rhizophora mucronata TaxID=61149 RepID=A0A2P2IHP2_RHIMU
MSKRIKLIQVIGTAETMVTSLNVLQQQDPYSLLFQFHIHFHHLLTDLWMSHLFA